MSLLDALLDLAAGTVCVGCARPGRVLCLACEAALPLRPRAARPTPRPAGLAPTVAAGGYDDPVVRAMVIAHKERRAFALARPLGDLLASAAAGLVERPCLAGSRVLLVPVPSRPAVVARRGHDPVQRVARRAAARLRAAGHDVRAVDVLRQSERPQDQGDLGGAQRRENVRRTMAARGAALRRLAREGAPVAAVVVDDVVTTGSTAREAQRALAAVGVSVAGIACVAATDVRTAGDGSPPIAYRRPMEPDSAI
ncbi:ComF family protein [Nocardioides mangrovicus]|uniref:ComF family protein n=1 Tax=Nocardioides mangrovicus TaxID=2478913 RepID=UPI001E42344B|nr:phosphoribosyltransferase family protein [Nocardioides mangrovicus]